MWNISLPVLKTQYVTSFKGGMHIMYYGNLKITILFLPYRFKLKKKFLLFKIYSLFCMDINITLFIYFF